jgi:hypothetical protein
MNYKQLLRVGSTVVETVEPRVVEETTYLTDEEVEFMMVELKKMQVEYFPDLPLASSLKHAKKFLYNIPRNVFNQIKATSSNGELEIESPLFMIYPLLVEGMGRGTQKIFLDRISYCITDVEGDEEDGDE